MVDEAIFDFTVVGVNLRSPVFRSTQREAQPWPVRMPRLVSDIKSRKPSVIMAQELATGEVRGGGQAAQFFSRVGWPYRGKILNCVGWNPDTWKLIDAQFVILPAGGQWPGRTLTALTLEHIETGCLSRYASSHLAVKTSSPPVSVSRAAALRTEQINIICDKLDEIKVPTILSMDGNSKATDLSSGSPRRVLKKFGWQWPTSLTGIDLVVSNYGASITTSEKIELGSNSDHDARLVFGGNTRSGRE